MFFNLSHFDCDHSSHRFRKQHCEWLRRSGFFVAAMLTEPTTLGVDYISVVGNIVYNSSGTSAYCATGIEIYEPVAYDSQPGTHIFVAGNFSYANVEPTSCGGNAPGDGEGVEFDAWDGSQTGTPMYSQRGVIDNNVFLANGGPGIEVFRNSTDTTPNSTIYILHNTVWGNNSNPSEVVPAYLVGEILTYSAKNIQVFENIAVTSAVESGAASRPIYAYWISNGNNTDNFYQNVGSAVGGTVNGTYGSSGFAYAPNNLFGINPEFPNPVVPGSPNCRLATSVPNCMAAVIANFMPAEAAATAYGYQLPSASQTDDPLFPRWLCNVNLPVGLVTMGCLPASSVPAAVTITNIQVQ